MLKSVHDFAQFYIKSGWRVVPIPTKDKRPVLPGWTDLQITEQQIPQYFSANSNIGIILGVSSGGLIDIDLDCKEALAAGMAVLPTTGMIFGHISKPASHYFFKTEPVATKQFRDIDGAMIVELRSTGGQTVVPSSTHPSGEPISFKEPFGDPTKVPLVELMTAVSQIAAVALIARHWPVVGSRQDVAMALSGVLLKHGWDEEATYSFIELTAQIAGDEEKTKRADCAKCTAAKKLQGENITGIPSLIKLIGKPVVDLFLKWLGIESTAPNLPEIKITVNEQKCVNEAIVALAKGSDLYQRGGLLVYLDQNSVIKPLSLPTLREIMSATAVWVRASKRGFLAEHVPDWACKELAARGYWEGIKSLVGVVTTPVLLSGGHILQEPGYDSKSGLLYVPSEKFPFIPENPTPKDAFEAVHKIYDVISDFPFADKEVHLAALFAALLTPFARYAFDGSTPLFLIDSNTPASGKGLLCDVISTIVNGAPLARMSYTNDDAEMRKKITGLAIAGSNMVLLDNIDGTFDSAALNAALTSGGRWHDRILGGNQIYDGPLNVIWYVTGNNVAAAGDLVRRICHIQIESRLEKPEERGGFKYPNLLNTVAECRVELVQAALIILRSYFASGAPRQSINPWGSFTGWNETVAAALVFNDFADPNCARAEFAKAVSGDVDAIHDLCDGLPAMYQGKEGLKTTEILRILEQNITTNETVRSAIQTLCPMPGGRLPDPQRLGYALRHIHRRVVGGKMLDKTRISGGAAVWRVRVVENT